MIKKIKPLMLSLCLAVTMFVGCGEQTASEPADEATKVEASKEQGDTEVKEDKTPGENDLVRADSVYLWASTLKTTENPKEITGLNSVLNTLPLTEESLNQAGNFKLDRRENAYFTTFSEMLDAQGDTDSKGNPHNWWEDDCVMEQETPKITYHAHNINEDNLTTRREMFEQGYWYVEAELDNLKSYKLWNEETAKWERFDYYIEVLGYPSYIRVKSENADRIQTEGAEFWNNYVDERYEEHNSKPDEEKMGLVSLSSTVFLVWEYEEFVLQAQLSEIVIARDTIMTTGLSSEIYALCYYPKDQWESYWKEKSVGSWKVTDVVLTE